MSKHKTKGKNHKQDRAALAPTDRHIATHESPESVAIQLVAAVVDQITAIGSEDERVTVVPA